LVERLWNKGEWGVFHARIEKIGESLFGSISPDENSITMGNVRKGWIKT